MSLTLLLVGGIILLALGNVALSLLPRKSPQSDVKVSFIPPSAAPLSTSSSDAKLDAHISSTSQKFSLLFSRMEKVEHSLMDISAKLSGDNSPSRSDETWIQTVPVRKKRKR